MVEKSVRKISNMRLGVLPYQLLYVYVEQGKSVPQNSIWMLVNSLSLLFLSTHFFQSENIPCIGFFFSSLSYRAILSRRGEDPAHRNQFIGYHSSGFYVEATFTRWNWFFFLLPNQRRELIMFEGNYEFSSRNFVSICNERFTRISDYDTRGANYRPNWITPRSVSHLINFFTFFFLSHSCVGRFENLADDARAIEIMLFYS